MKNKNIWYDELISLHKNPTYKQLLQTYEWKIKRFEILKRDDFKCSECEHSPNRKYLRVHHSEYISGLLPWNHPNKLLITLCDECHSKEHGKENLNAKFRSGFADYIKNGNRF